MVGQKAPTGRRLVWLALVIVLQLACWRGSSRLKVSTSSVDWPSQGQRLAHTNLNQSWTGIQPKLLLEREEREEQLEADDRGASIPQPDSDGKVEKSKVESVRDRDGDGDQMNLEEGSWLGIGSENYERRRKRGIEEDQEKEEKERKHNQKKEQMEHRSSSSIITTTSSPHSSSSSSSIITNGPKKHDTARWSTTTTRTSTSDRLSISTPLLPCDPLPLQLPPAKLCAHVRAHCPPSGHFDYLGFFYCQGVEQRKDPDSNSSILRNQRSSSSTNSSIPKERDHVSIFKSHKHRKGDAEFYPVSTRISILRSLALAIIIAWMLFLFSWVGIVASDFFCPNLSTIASRLGLNESTAGVTFLAFGNGSPDVFSTFGAMKSGSGSLAIGELLGAASFIVSVISGSMMLIKPFRVKAFPFLRDVGFFTVAVAVTMAFLLDGKLRLVESLCLIGLYFAYATTVIVGSWWQERSRRQKLMIATARSEYSNSISRVDMAGEDDEMTNPYQGVGGEEAQAERPKTPGKKPRISSRSRTHEDLERQAGLLSVPSPYLTPLSPSSEYDPDTDPLELWADTPSAGMRAIAGIASAVGAPSSSSPLGSPGASPRLSPGGSMSSRTSRGENQLGNLGMMRSQSKFRPGANPRHSLLGAIEFRDVVRSLRAESNYSDADDRSLEIFQSRDPEAFYPHHHNHPHQHHQTRPRHRRSETLTHRRISSLTRPDSSLEPASAYEYLSARDRANSVGNGNMRPQVHRSKSTGNHLKSELDGGRYFSSVHGYQDGVESNSVGDGSGFASLARSRERDAAAGTDGQIRDVDVRAATAGLDDPWREEHTVNDNCEDAAVLSTSPLIKPGGLHSKFSRSDQMRLGLPRIGIDSRNISDDLLLPPSSAERTSNHSVSPVPSIKISKSLGNDADSSLTETPTSTRHTKSRMSTSLSRRSRPESGFISSADSPRTRSTSESIGRHVRFARRALFPSLRHFREKSWLGIVVSVLTAPALFALNLTLPVVDDEAEQQLSLIAEGQLRLEGAESNLNARKAFEEQDDDERIIQLGEDDESDPQVSPESLVEHQDRFKRIQRVENSERDREIAHTLGRLPLGERPISPARPSNGRSPGLSGRPNGSISHQLLEETGRGTDASDCSDDTCSTTDSIFGEAASPANSELFPIQCILAPPFCTWAIVSSSGASEITVRKRVILAFIFGSSLAIVSFLAALRARRVGGEWLSRRNLVMAGNVRCGIGFVVSVMWIMTIVDEVVSILQTIGIIVGLSDAILGLTVFAVGNSLGDLVANVTIAKMGHPVMAVSLRNSLLDLSGGQISACFAGPLLNLLLGIGISGSWILSRPASAVHSVILEDGIYHIDFSPTLIVSGLGLLTVLIGTLIAVPMNGFLLSRKLGTTLIAAYACIMLTNILVEVFYSEL